jgi:hypothetical protein
MEQKMLFIPCWGIGWCSTRSDQLDTKAKPDVALGAVCGEKNGASMFSPDSYKRAYNLKYGPAWSSDHDMCTFMSGPDAYGRNSSMQVSLVLREEIAKTHHGLTMQLQIWDLLVPLPRSALQMIVLKPERNKGVIQGM